MTCRLCEKPSQVRCSRCGGALCGFHAGLHVETCPRCGQPWFGVLDPTIERIQVLAWVEHMAEAPGPHAHRQVSAGLSTWIQIAKRIGIPREQWLHAARRGAARRARAQRQGIVERLAG